MERMIKSIHMGNGFNGDGNPTSYTVKEIINGNLEVKLIIYKRDGLQSINNRSGSCYLVILINELNKETIFKVIPAKFVQEITFIEIEEEKDDGVEVERI